nr:hypothetical protein HmN_000658300 [Hymenolepis microstoma]
MIERSNGQEQTAIFFTLAYFCHVNGYHWFILAHQAYWPLARLGLIEVKLVDPGFIFANTSLEKLSSFTAIFAKVGKKNSALWIGCSCNAFGTYRAHRELAQAKIFYEN